MKDKGIVFDACPGGALVDHLKLVRRRGHPLGDRQAAHLAPVLYAVGKG